MGEDLIPHPERERSPGRRLTDMDTMELMMRVAVLEKIVENQVHRANILEEDYKSTIDSIEQRIDSDQLNRVISERTLATTVTTLDGVVATLKSTTEIATEAKTVAHKHEIIGQTTLKIGSILVVVAGGLWAILKFIIGLG